MPKPKLRRPIANIGPKHKRPLVMSADFQMKADAAIAHVLVHRNTTPLYQILAAFELTQSFKGLVAYFRNKAGVWPAFEHDRVVLKRGVAMQGETPSLAACLEQHKGSIKDVLGPQARMAPILYVDALTQGIRLPGSFGSGKQR